LAQIHSFSTNHIYLGFFSTNQLRLGFILSNQRAARQGRIGQKRAATNQRREN
jgi:hypothetical protein